MIIRAIKTQSHLLLAITTKSYRKSYVIIYRTAENRMMTLIFWHVFICWCLKCRRRWLLWHQWQRRTVRIAWMLV